VTGDIQDEDRIDAFYFGSGHCLALTTSQEDSPRKKKVWVFGTNNYGQMGDGQMTFESHSTATTIQYFTRIPFIKKIAVGTHHCALVTPEGSLFMWGSNISRQCGFFSKDENFTYDYTGYILIPRRIVFVSAVQGIKVRCLDIACSRKHNLAICEDNNSNRRTCYSWGEQEMLGMPVKDVSDSYPNEIVFFSRQDVDVTIVEIGVGCSSSYCVVKKAFFHLSDPILQDEKLDLLRELYIM